MKNSYQILSLIKDEFKVHLDKIPSSDEMLSVNSEFGDLSFLLAGLLQQDLKRDNNIWLVNKWIDDSLIYRISYQNEKIVVVGVMIWGVFENTKQWVSPFLFRIKISENANLKDKYEFCFIDTELPELRYEDFKETKHVWVDKWDKMNWKLRLNNLAE